MQKDIAFLKVHNADFESLQFKRETYGKMPVMVRRFPSEDLERLQ